jgi:DNA-binding YbaB/EbfC family protein|tara:strand:+ start:615 stop:923 length:309 start_codon:yes stop_codon:yes gene_type:complete
MAGVGKLMKQAAKMQKKMQELQDELATQTLEVSSGGGAVKVVVTLQQAVNGLEIDEEFLKEDKAMVEETILEAFREALEQSKAKSEEAMNAITQSAQMPGLF